MGFKIGDRVRVPWETCGVLAGATGVVTANDPDLLYPYRVILDGDAGYPEGRLFHEHELGAPIAPRGPKPLTLTGGTRFTVTAGRTMRKPTSHWSNHVWLLRPPGRNP